MAVARGTAKTDLARRLGAHALLDSAPAAYDRMMSGAARFRMVLKVA